MARFKVVFKKETGNRGTKQFVPLGFEVLVESNSSAIPHDSEVKRAVEEKLGTSFNYSCSRGLWEAQKL
jgi:hypothetical protein